MSNQSSSSSSIIVPDTPVSPPPSPRKRKRKCKRGPDKRKLRMKAYPKSHCLVCLCPAKEGDSGELVPAEAENLVVHRECQKRVDARFQTKTNGRCVCGTSGGCLIPLPEKIHLSLACFWGEGKELAATNIHIACAIFIMKILMIATTELNPTKKGYYRCSGCSSSSAVPLMVVCNSPGCISQFHLTCALAQGGCVVKNGDLHEFYCGRHTRKGSILECEEYEIVFSKDQVNVPGAIDRFLGSTHKLRLRPQFARERKTTKTNWRARGVQIEETVDEETGEVTFQVTCPSGQAPNFRSALRHFVRQGDAPRSSRSPPPVPSWQQQGGAEQQRGVTPSRGDQERTIAFGQGVNFPGAIGSSPPSSPVDQGSVQLLVPDEVRRNSPVNMLVDSAPSSAAIKAARRAQEADRDSLQLGEFDNHPLEFDNRPPSVCAMPLPEDGGDAQKAIAALLCLQGTQPSSLAPSGRPEMDDEHDSRKRRFQVDEMAKGAEKMQMAKRQRTQKQDLDNVTIDPFSIDTRDLRPQPSSSSWVRSPPSQSGSDTGKEEAMENRSWFGSVSGGIFD